MIEKLPPPETPGVAFERVRCLMALYNASVTSGGRTQQRNALVGGSEGSKHLIEQGCIAWDLVPNRPADLHRLSEAARVLGFSVRVGDGYVHAQGRPPGVDAQ